MVPEENEWMHRVYWLAVLSRPRLHYSARIYKPDAFATSFHTSVWIDQVIMGSCYFRMKKGFSFVCVIIDSCETNFVLIFLIWLGSTVDTILRCIKNDFIIVEISEEYLNIDRITCSAGENQYLFFNYDYGFIDLLRFNWAFNTSYFER